MAKMTISQLKAAVTAYVVAAKQAGTWASTTDNTLDLLDKVGKIVTLDGSFEDKLAMLSGQNLPLGKTIEEYFIDLTLPEAYDSTGANALAPHDPSVEQVTYSYTLGRKKIPTTTRFDDVERAALTAEGAASMISNKMKKLYDSQSLYEFAIKKQLLANMIAKAEAASNASTLVQTLSAPSNTTTAEAFIKQVKEDVETASFSTEGHNLGNYLIGAAPELLLIVKKGVMPTVEVDALAGAFNQERLAVPAKVVVVDDFGNDASGAYAMLIDPRGVSLHNGYKAVRSQTNADGDYINHFLHSEFTGFISKSTFIKVYKG